MKFIIPMVRARFLINKLPLYRGLVYSNTACSEFANALTSARTILSIRTLREIEIVYIIYIIIIVGWNNNKIIIYQYLQLYFCASYEKHYSWSWNGKTGNVKIQNYFGK